MCLCAVQSHDPYASMHQDEAEDQEEEEEDEGVEEKEGDENVDPLDPIIMRKVQMKRRKKTQMLKRIHYGTGGRITVSIMTWRKRSRMMQTTMMKKRQQTILVKRQTMVMRRRR